MSQQIFQIPKYRLDIRMLVQETTFSNTFYFSNLNKLKNFLGISSFSNVIGAHLYLQSVVQTGEYTLTTQTLEQVDSELDNIKYDYYRLEIASSNTATNIFYQFKSIYEIKKFIRKYHGTSGTGVTLKYKVYKYTTYFDKDDSYKLKQSYQLLSNNIW